MVVVVVKVFFCWTISLCFLAYMARARARVYDLTLRFFERNGEKGIVPKRVVPSSMATSPGVQDMSAILEAYWLLAAKRFVDNVCMALDKKIMGAVAHKMQGALRLSQQQRRRPRPRQLQ